ncbi:MAG: MarR family transcriptional regulator [Methanobacteriota archaeon]|nr:MAG: MarR family transcriptional regulator [Euryarchaeota archaeon]
MLHIQQSVVMFETMKYKMQHCIGARLRRLSRIVDNYYRNALSGFGITEKQMTILFFLSEMGRVEQGKIGRFLVLDKSTVSRNVKLLEKQGLIQKSGQYRPAIELTQKGRGLVQKLIPIWEKTMDELVAKLGVDGMKQVEELEKKLT